MTTGTASVPVPAGASVPPIAGSVPASTSLSWASRVVCVAAAVMAIVRIFETPLNGDVAWTLTFARRLLEGARPYVDIVDYQPPLIFFLNVPVEMVALVTGWPESPVLALAVIGLTAVSLSLIWRILRAERARDELFVATTLVGSLLTMLVMPSRDLGQGEHLMIIMVLPYAVWCARLSAVDTREPLPLRLAIGLLACVGFAIKPPFLIAFVTLLAYLAWSRQGVRSWFAAEHLMIAAGTTVYALTVVLFLPEYVSRVLPMAYTHDWLRGELFGELLSDWMLLAIAGSSLGLAIVAPWLTKDRQWAALVRVCAGISLALLAAFVVQRRATAANFLPVRAFNFLAAWLAVAGFVKGLMAPAAAGVSATRVRLALAARTSLFTLALIPPIVVVSMVADVQMVDVANAGDGIRSPLAEPLIDIVHERAAGKPIFVMSSAVSPAFPLVNLSGATWPYRFKSLSFVTIYYGDIDDPSHAAYRPPAAQVAGERALFDDVVEELIRTPPALLIVDRGRLKQGFGLTHFDFLEYYGQSPAFAGLMRHYRVIAKRKTFQIFEYQPSI
jgi:hypothetical protein